MNQCPVCKGRGSQPGIACGDSGCKPDNLKCSLCGGAGEIPDQQKRWWEVGLFMRDCRRTRGKTLREEAKARGMTASFLSGMEQGRIEPVVSHEDGGPQWPI